jgi:hypothetical protein
MQTVKAPISFVGNVGGVALTGSIGDVCSACPQIQLPLHLVPWPALSSFQEK